MLSNLLRPALPQGGSYRPYDRATWVGSYLAGSANELVTMAVPPRLAHKRLIDLSAAAYAAQGVVIIGKDKWTELHVLCAMFSSASTLVLHGALLLAIVVYVVLRRCNHATPATCTCANLCHTIWREGS